MSTLMVFLKKQCPFLESLWFARLSWIAAVFAPAPLALQLYRTITASSVEGVSVAAYSLLAVVHFILVGRGIKNLDSRVVVTFVLTSVTSFLIVVAVLFRTYAR